MTDNFDWGLLYFFIHAVNEGESEYIDELIGLLGEQNCKFLFKVDSESILPQEIKEHCKRVSFRQKDFSHKELVDDACKYYEYYYRLDTKLHDWSFTDPQHGVYLVNEDTIKSAKNHLSELYE